MTKKVGELASWDDGDPGVTSDFMNLKEGDNVVRIVTNPYQFFVAWVKDASGANRKIRSAIENCPLVKAGHTPRPRWYVGVLNRAEGGVPKVLEIPSTVFNMIRNYQKDPDWGDVTQYDLNIKRGPKGSPPASLYTVVPKPRKPLTAEEKAAVAAFKERVDISKFTTPPTPEEVAEKLGVTLNGSQPQMAVGDKTINTVNKPAATVEDDDDFSFGDEDEL